jgi:hypothetical protein
MMKGSEWQRVVGVVLTTGQTFRVVKGSCDVQPDGSERYETSDGLLVELKDEAILGHQFSKT